MRRVPLGGAALFLVGIYAYLSGSNKPRRGPPDAATDATSSSSAAPPPPSPPSSSSSSSAAAAAARAAGLPPMPEDALAPAGNLAERLRDKESPALGELSNRGGKSGYGAFRSE